MEPGNRPITTSGTNSEATGLSAFGVNADGLGSQVNLAGLTVTTAGANATACSPATADDRAADAPSITAFGNGANGVYASGVASPSVQTGVGFIALGGATITTAGASATGLKADAGGLRPR